MTRGNRYLSNIHVLLRWFILGIKQQRGGNAKVLFGSQFDSDDLYTTKN